MAMMYSPLRTLPTHALLWALACITPLGCGGSSESPPADDGGDGDGDGDGDNGDGDNGDGDVTSGDGDITAGDGDGDQGDGDTNTEPEPCDGGTGSCVRVVGRKLFVNGEVFHVKGISWNPIPKGGTHPQALDYPGFADLDIPMMVEAGINTVRTYEPLLDRGVLDKLHDAGIYVINSVYPWGGSTIDTATARVNQVVDHPAILMWLVGNEWNYNNLYTGNQHDIGWTMRRVQDVAAAIHGVDASHPVITSYGHVPPTATINAIPDVDLWGANVYTGISLDGVFSEYRSRTPKPLLITEYGADAWNAQVGYDEASQAEATRVLTQSIFDHCSALHDDGIAVGGSLYSWSDEWDKAGNPSDHDIGGSAPGGGPYPDMVFNEEYWGIVDIDRVKRQAYDALKELYTQ